mgnify:CR=1 FL=1
MKVKANARREYLKMEWEENEEGNKQENREKEGIRKNEEEDLEEREKEKK